MKQNVFSALLFVLTVFGSLAQPRVSKVAINIVPNSSNAIYNIGEVAKFKVFVTDCGTPLNNATIYYEVSEDQMKPHITDSITLKGFEGEINAQTMKTPGFLRVKASVKHKNRTYSSISTVGFEPKKLTPKTIMPDDFMQFWENGIKAINKVALSPIMTLNKERCTDKVDVYNISYGNIGNTRIYGTLTIPHGNGQYSAVIRYPGGGFSPRTGDAIHASQGVIVLEIGIHGIPVNQPTSIYQSLNSVHSNYMSYNMDNPLTFFYYRAFLGCLKAIDFVLSLPQCNGKIGVIGGSQGGALSIAVSALDHRVMATAAYHPGLCDLEGFLHNRAGGYPFYFRDKQNRTPEKLTTLRYYDIANFATLLKNPIHYTYGYNDMICTPTSTCATYNIITAPKTLNIAQDIGHWLYPELTDDMWEWLICQLNK